MKWIKSGSGKVLISSAIWILYIALLLWPVAEKYGLLNETTAPQADARLIYFLLSTPVYIAYIVFVCVNCKKITFPKSLIYPVIVFCLYVGLFACLLVFGGPILWLMVFSILIPVICIPISFIIGLVLDIRRRKKLKKDNP